MLVKILTSFGYAPDGFTTRQLATGDVEQILDDLAAGLIAEGFVEPAEEIASAERAAVVPNAPAAEPTGTGEAGPPADRPAPAADGPLSPSKTKRAPRKPKA